MSDADELLHRIHGYQFHIRTKRRPFEVEEAFLDCFNTMAGGIVLEAIHDKIAMEQTPLGWESRAEGQKDLWLFIVKMRELGVAARTGRIGHGEDAQPAPAI